MTVKHGTLDQMKDAMNVWIESISRSQFEVCLRESRTFGGAHNGLVVVHVTLILNDFNLFLSDCNSLSTVAPSSQKRSPSMIAVSSKGMRSWLIWLIWQVGCTVSVVVTEKDLRSFRWWENKFPLLLLLLLLLLLNY